jgi:beta-carotene 3-hydroxylase
MTLIYKALTVLATFMVMECVAWLTHKYIMHGIFWFLHKDHHQKEHSSFFERNDFFFLIFAVPGIICLALGVHLDFNLLFWIGLGITIYGGAYFFVHDIFIHQRFKLLRNTNNAYFKAVRRAHKMHHKHTQKEDGECFGMLWIPLKYFKTSK